MSSIDRIVQCIWEAAYGPLDPDDGYSCLDPIYEMLDEGLTPAAIVALLKEATA